MNHPSSLPKFRCHKIVGAAKIKSIDPPTNQQPDGLILSFEGDGIPQRPLSQADLQRKPTPEVGGYMVEYEDGYLSFSPAQAFEDGYTPFEDAPGQNAHVTLDFDLTDPKDVEELHDLMEYLADRKENPPEAQGSGSDKYGESDWTAAKGEGLDYPS